MLSENDKTQTLSRIWKNENETPDLANKSFARFKNLQQDVLNSVGWFCGEKWEIASMN